MVYLDGPLPIRQALEDARVILHHGSMLTSEEALAAGRPQLVAPLYLEHLFTARALSALGVAHVWRPSLSGQQVAEMLASTLSSGALARRAHEYAERFWRTAAPHPDLPRRLLEAIVPN
jgi:UDP:flavonoid glycosyltransferase YjiC (YdhE family)